MRCRHCQFDSPDGVRFCGWCGQKVGNRCARCSSANSLDFQFCGECGAALGSGAATPRAERPIRYTPRYLAERILAEQAALERRGATDGERKTITALFADIQGSMDLLEGLDPEEARGIVDPALERMMDAVHRYEGYVAQSTGDGIFAMFGAPIAHEDHPQRSLYAALRMQEEVRKYAEGLRHDRGVNLEIRVGINTGEVVLRSIRRDDLHTDYAPIGHSTGLAARMETLATPGTIVVTEHTHRLTDGYFEFRSLGPTRVKGVSDPVNVHQLVGVGALRTKLEMAARRGLTRFVGRQAEMAQLEKSLGHARSGHGQIVGVMGEPGIGKSRLLHELKLVARSDCVLFEGFAVSHGKAYPYLPLIEMLKAYFGITREDDDGRKREKIIAKCTALERATEDAVYHLFALMGVLAADSPLHHMDPQIRRARTFEALKALLLGEARQRTLVMIVEDLHWIDSETEAFLVALGETIATARLLLLVNYRPEYAHRWGNKTYLTQIRLDPLEEKSAAEMVTAMLGDDRELRPLQRLILEKSEGTPFFMEEIVRALFEAGVLVRNGRVRLVTPLDEIRIPPTVDGMIAARIDRLAPEEKELVQAAAVIGREFPLAVLAGVMGKPEAELRASLSRLQSAEFVYEQLAASDAQYIFKHALTRDIAYHSLLVERRTDLHEEAAKSIEALYESRLEEHYSDLAHQYTHSRNTEKALEYSQLAGQQAARQFANADAIKHLTTALGLVASFPQTRERAEREVDLQLALGALYQAQRGYAAPEVETAYARARELCEQLGEIQKLFTVLRGLWAFYFIRGDQPSAGELAHQCLALAERTGDRAMRLEAHFAVGGYLQWGMGDYVPAREHFQQTIDLYDSRVHRSHVFIYGQDPGVTALWFASVGEWFLGHPDLALATSRRAMALADESGHPFDRAEALASIAFVHVFRGDASDAQAVAEALISLCEERGFPWYRAFGLCFRGWSLARQGRSDEGIAQLREGIDAKKTAGGNIARAMFLVWLAEAVAGTGQTARALETLDEAREFIARNTGRIYEPEIHRLKGELLLRSDGRQHEARACFQKAIDLARRDGSKSLELRAVTSLARLLSDEGQRAEACEMLAEIYGWFSEGFDASDLVEAAALLRSFSEARLLAPQSAASENTFRKEGQYWTIAWDGKVFRLKDARGLSYLAQLLRHPDCEIYAADLICAGAGANGSAHDGSLQARADLGDAGEMLDAKARSAYKQRLVDLRQELEEAQAHNDTGRAELLRAEIEGIASELERGIGLGGRSRRAASHAERARINVTRSISNAIGKIRNEHPALARYLSATVTTGMFCCYTPDPEKPVAFVV